MKKMKKKMKKFLNLMYVQIMKTKKKIVLIN